MVLSVMAALLLPAAIALACGPNRKMQCDRMSYSPGGQVTCSGVNFYENINLTLTLSDGSPAGSGSVTTTSEGTFSTSFAAPSAPGAYTLVVEGYDEDGNPRVGLPARQSFTVEAPPSAQPTPGASPQAPTPGATPAPGVTPTRPGATAPTPGGKSPTRQGSGRPNRGGDQGRSQPVLRAEGNGGRRGSSRTGDGVSAPPASFVNPDEEVIENAGQQVFGGSVPRADRAAAASGGNGSPAPSSGSSAATPAEGSAAGDLWSGFGSDANPSLVPGANDPLAPETDAGSSVTVGAGLLGLGLLILMATLALAEARRRRAER